MILIWEDLCEGGNISKNLSLDSSVGKNYEIISQDKRSGELLHMVL